MFEMKKEEAVEFLLVLKDRAEPIHIKNSRGEWTYSVYWFCEAIDMAIAALLDTKN